MYCHAVRLVRSLLPPLIGCLLAAGCAGGSSQKAEHTGFFDQLAPKTTASFGPPPAEDKSGCGTAAQCRSLLKSLIDDRDRSWVGQLQPAAAYANGTRLFAYRAVRKKLNCRELGLAIDEVRTATKAYDGPVQGVAPDQVSRTRTLGAQVEGELAKERSARCRA